MANFDNTTEYYGRKMLKTNLSIIGDIKADAETVKLILESVLKTHEQNVQEETELFNIFLNNPEFWEKTKVQRQDINNKISIPTAWSLTRTINGFCFGEPIKYLLKDIDETNNSQSLSEEQKSKQKQIEILSAYLDTQHNHDSTVMATLSASICGLGYKLALPSTDEEIEETGVPFVINTNFIYPQLAGVVYSDSPIPKPVMGFLEGKYYNPNTGEEEGVQYTCWTKYAQYVLKKSEQGEGYDLVKQKVGETEVDFYELATKRIPLVEVERNAFRKGDWEVAKDLIKLRNELTSVRQDDVQQIIDYVLVLINCDFESNEDKNNAINSRLISLKVQDPSNKPSVDILKNALEQAGLQQYADYLDLLIQESVGVPNRQERGGGGGDTGQAVKYRNGFRDLENNAGLIISKMDKAELQFLALCINYCQTSSIRTLDNLKPYEVRCKFMRTLNDDIVSSATAFATYFANGVSMEDSLIMSNSGTDVNEIVQKSIKAKQNGYDYKSLVGETTSTTNNATNVNETTETTQKETQTVQKTDDNNNITA